MMPAVDLLQAMGWLVFSLFTSLFIVLLISSGAVSLASWNGLLGKGIQEPLTKKVSPAMMVPSLLFVATAPLITLGLFPKLFHLLCSGMSWLCLAAAVGVLLQFLVLGYIARSGAANRFLRVLLVLCGTAAPFFSGIIFATFYTGNPFTPAGPTVSGRAVNTWIVPLNGFTLLSDWRNLALGLSFVFLTRLYGGMYLLQQTENSAGTSLLKRYIATDSGLFLILFLTFTASLLMMPGQFIESGTERILWEPLKYRHNFLQMPFVMLGFSAGVIFILLGVLLPLYAGKKPYEGLLYGLAGGLATLVSLLLLAGFNRTAYHPSTADPIRSLTIHNSSSGVTTLTVTIFLSLIPILYGLTRLRKMSSGHGKPHTGDKTPGSCS